LVYWRTRTWDFHPVDQQAKNGEYAPPKGRIRRQAPMEPMSSALAV
jgi:hypothetical protein